MKKLNVFYRLKFYFLYNPKVSFSLILLPIFLLLIFDFKFKMFGIINGQQVDYKFVGFFLGYVLFYLNFRNNSLKNLFSILSEFNKRYDVLNNNLFSKNVTDSVIYDYFNICAEEYYFYQHGLIPSDIWDSWFIGMKDVFSQKRVQTIALIEFNNKISKSYYGFNPFDLGLLKSS